MAPALPSQDPVQSAEEEVLELEAKLEKARRKLKTLQVDASSVNGGANAATSHPSHSLSNSATTHFLLLLSDSALPLGSFAFSSGLESYLAHTRSPSYLSALSSSASSSSPGSASQHGGGSTPRFKPSFASFLPDSVSSYAATTLPFVLAAHRAPQEVAMLDDLLDATLICVVGRRASTAQGRALLGIWERSFVGAVPQEALEVLRPFAALLRNVSSYASSTVTGTSISSSSARSSANSNLGSNTLPPVSAHLGPLFGAIASLLGLTARQTAYVFLLSHVKALVSAAVRASMFGPYQAQKTLASTDVQAMIAAAVDREWDTPVEEAGQTVPVMDLWIGRHEMLYSRIFNS